MNYKLLSALAVLIIPTISLSYLFGYWQGINYSNKKWKKAFDDYHNKIMSSMADTLNKLNTIKPR